METGGINVGRTTDEGGMQSTPAYGQSNRCSRWRTGWCEHGTKQLVTVALGLAVAEPGGNLGKLAIWS